MKKHPLPLMMAAAAAASVGAFTATEKLIAYLASKGTQLITTKATTLECREHNIRVNALCPGKTCTVTSRAWARSA
jgi:short-subunit dehydrogenase